MASPAEFKGLIEPVARALLGEPNRSLSHNGELRFGSHGSLSIDTEHDRFFDHETKEGGGVLDLVTYETGAHSAGEAAEWLRKNGFLTESRSERRELRKGQKRKVEATYDYVDESGDLL